MGTLCPLWNLNSIILCTYVSLLNKTSIFPLHRSIADLYAVLKSHARDPAFKISGFASGRDIKTESTVCRNSSQNFRTILVAYLAVSSMGTLMSCSQQNNSNLSVYPFGEDLFCSHLSIILHHIQCAATIDGHSQSLELLQCYTSV